MTVIENLKNKGAGYCRNLALKMAKGIYISYIDGDDTIPSNFLMEMVHTIKDRDVAICDIITKLFNNSDVRVSCRFHEQNRIEAIDNSLAGSMCNKLCRKESLMKYPFMEGMINEDICVAIPVVLLSKNVFYTDKTYYNYIQHEKSVQNSKFTEKKLDAFKAVEITLQRLNNFPNIENVQEILVYHQLLSILYYEILNIPDSKERKLYLQLFATKINHYNLKKMPKIWNELNKKNFIFRWYYKRITKMIMKMKINNANFNISLFQLLKKIKKRRKLKITTVKQ